MKKIILAVLLVAGLAGAYFAYTLWGSSTNTSSQKYIYIKAGDTYESVKDQLVKRGFLSSFGAFDKVASLLKYPKLVKPGRYEIKPGTSMYTLVKQLRSGAQTPVNFVINFLRTKEEFASKVAQNFEMDSLSFISFLNNPDSLEAYKVDSNTVLSVVIPNTYAFNWNTTPGKLFKKLASERDKFWTEERIKKANAHNLTPAQAYTLASIVEEETKHKDDKGKVASVYLNRLETGMRLEADPTLKFAARDFGLKRVLNVHKEINSPYNTYKNLGLPPGPICTPGASTIDAVLNAPQTDYIFFVAQPNLSGLSNFASTYAQHQIYAKEYQVWIGEYLKKKAAQEKAKLEGK